MRGTIFCNFQDSSLQSNKCHKFQIKECDEQMSTQRTTIQSRDDEPSPRADSSREYPQATAAVLIDEDDDDDTSSRFPLALTKYLPDNKSNSNFASAHVVGSSDSAVSPFSRRLARATETGVTATALDPWSKTTTASTELDDSDSSASESSDTPSMPMFTYDPTLPQEEAIYLEDPLTKKYRRRRRRRTRMAVSGMVGFVLGSVLGPVGAVACAASAMAMARTGSKAGERRKDMRTLLQITDLQQEGRLQQHSATN